MSSRSRTPPTSTSPSSPSTSMRQRSVDGISSMLRGLKCKCMQMTSLLSDHLYGAGDVISCRVLRERDGRSRGVALARLSSKRACEVIIARLHGFAPRLYVHPNIAVKSLKCINWVKSLVFVVISMHCLQPRSAIASEARQRTVQQAGYGQAKHDARPFKTLRVLPCEYCTPL